MNMPEADMDRFSFPLDALIETQKVFQFLKGARFGEVCSELHRTRLQHHGGLETHV